MFSSMIPWRERLPMTVPRLEHEMEDLMERYLGNGGDWQLTRFIPSLNVLETEKEYTVSAELPGLKSEDVKVEFSAGVLQISGNKHEESEEKGKTFHRVECRHGQFRRMIQLPTTVEENEVEAKFKDGVLTITVPKSKESQAKRIPIKS